MLIDQTLTTSTSATALKALARRHFEELWTQGQLTLVDELYDPQCVGHCGILPDQTDDYPASEQAIVARDRAGFPDAVVTVDDQLAEGDRVFTRWTMRASHTVPLFGRDATGRQIVLHGMHVHRVKDGRIVEVWAIPDTLGLFGQLGLIADPGAPDPLQANKAVVRRYLDEGFGPNGQELLDEIVASGYVEHGRGWFRVSELESISDDTGQTSSDGREGLKGTHRWLLAAFPDLRFQVNELIAEGDRVVAYSSNTGTQHGVFQGVPPTGRRFQVKRIDIFRLANGCIAEHWAVRDDLTQAHQLGAVSSWE
jgi:predicted ester cyclase